LTDAGGGGPPRQIGALAAAFLAFNGVVGAGIFALPGRVLAEFGAFGPWLFPLFGVLMLVVAVPLAVVAARFDVSGGPQAYVSQAFGPLAGFQAGWLFAIAKATALAANATVAVSYAVALLPGSGGEALKAAILIFVLGGLGVANWLGLKGAVRLLEWSTWAKAGPLILMAVAGLALFWRKLPAVDALPPLSTLEASALVIFYAFVGFENAMVTAGETRDARRSIPRALLQTIVATALLYFLVQLAYTAVAPAGTGTGVDAPLIAFGAAIAGPAGGLLMIGVALASLTGNLHGNLMTTPHLLRAMAERGQLPGWFGRLSPRFGTPANALWVFVAASLLLALSGGFVVLAVLGVVARLLLFLMIYAALPRLRAQAGERAAPPWPLMAAMALGSAVCLWALAQNTPEAWWKLAVALGVGGLLFMVARRPTVQPG
jgi:basic amino acid/polyamine antiporter, APA family